MGVPQCQHWYLHGVNTGVDCDLVFVAAGQHHLQTPGVDSTPELTLVLTPAWCFGLWIDINTNTDTNSNFKVTQCAAADNTRDKECASTLLLYRCS
jgi:hypothetical protein